VRWQLEELRVATFAQPLMLKRPGQNLGSAKRVSAALASTRLTHPVSLPFVSQFPVVRPTGNPTQT
jgi:hypothetical protein